MSGQQRPAGRCDTLCPDGLTDVPRSLELDTLITADRVLTGDPLGAAPPALEPTAVLVRDMTIHAVGDEQRVRAQARPGARELAHPGCTVLPGLINTHVHLCGDLSREPFGTAQHGDTDVLAALMQTNAGSALRGGYTTVRDLGDARGLAFALRDRIAAGELTGPRIVAAGTPLTIPDGHCWFLGGVVDGRAAIVARIDELAGAGADVIKVMAGGGQMTPTGPPQWESQFGPDALALIVEHAARRGLPVAAHAHGTPTIADCVRAGVSTVEHCSWRTGPGRMDRRDDVAVAMARDGIAVGDTTPPQWRELAERIPMPEGVRLGDHLPWLAGHGVRIVAGTDSGLPNAVFDDPVASLEMYREQGFGNDWILDAATGRAADVIGLGGVTGRIREGLAADLLVVDGDPRSDLRALRHLRLVMARGRTDPPGTGSARPRRL